MKRYFPLIFCALGLALLPSPTRAQGDKPKTTVLRGTRDAHHYQLRFVTGPFRKDEHQTSGTGSAEDMAHIDGKPEWKPNIKANDVTMSQNKNWFGTDGGFPSWEFKSFEVTVDRHRWKVPLRLWQDCYEGGFRTFADGSKNYWITLAPDGQKLALGMNGSDGAGTYYVVWYLRADGRHSREIRG